MINNPRSSCLILGLLFFAFSGAWADPEWKVSVKHHDGAFFIHAEVDIEKVNPKQVFKVLCDYNRISEMVPNMKISEILENPEPNRYRIRQVSREGFLFIRKHISVIMEVTETPFHQIAFHSVEGDFYKHEGSWTIDPQENFCRLTFQSNTQPKIKPPFFLRETIVRNSTLANLRALLSAITTTESSPPVPDPGFIP